MEEGGDPHGGGRRPPWRRAETPMEEGGDPHGGGRRPTWRRAETHMEEGGDPHGEGGDPHGGGPAIYGDPHPRREGGGVEGRAPMEGR